MTLKQDSNQTENLRQATRSFRDAIDVLSCPFSSSLENIFLAEKLSEDFNVSLPLVGMMPFSALKSENNIDTAYIEKKDKTPERNCNNNFEWHQATKSRGETTQENTMQTKNVSQVRGIDQSKVNTSKNDSNGNIVTMNDKARSVSRVQQFTIRDTNSEIPQIPAKHNNKEIRQNLGFSELTTTTPIKVSSIEPLPTSANPNQVQAQDGNAVENTLVVVDNLVQKILGDQHQAYAKHKEVDSSLNLQSLDKHADKPHLAMTALRAMPQDDVRIHTEKRNHPHKKNMKTNNLYNSRAEGSQDTELQFTGNQFRGNNFNGSDNCQTLSNSFIQIGIVADEILQSSITGRRENIKSQKNDKKNSWSTCDNSDLSVSDLNTRHNIPSQQTKGDYPSSNISNATSVGFNSNNSISENSLDKDAITTLVNEALAEQAKRHGVDLS